jgi:hypothetical protein
LVSEVGESDTPIFINGARGDICERVFQEKFRLSKIFFRVLQSARQRLPVA